MKQPTILYSILLLIFTSYTPVNSQIIADHTVVDKYDDIPQYYIDEVKKMWLVYAGESHSAAIRSGLSALEAISPAYAVSVTESGTPEAYTASHLRASRATWGDIDHTTGWIYSYGEEDWCCFTDYPVYTYNPAAVAQTKAGILYCNTNNLTIGAMGFGHCYDDGQALAYSYVKATKEYIDFCATNGYSTKIFFTTGPIDGGMSSGELGYDQFQKWEIVRDSVSNNPTRILFDYADILSCNNAGELSTASYDGHIYPVIHPDNLEGAYSGHIGGVGALRLAKAMWWMLARIAGWDGGTAVIHKNESNPDIYFERLSEKIIFKSNNQFSDLNHFALYSIDGKLLINEKIESDQINIDITTISSGIYIIAFTGNQDQISLKFFIP